MSSIAVLGNVLITNEVVSFIDEGGNVLAAAGTRIGTVLRELAIQNGFQFDNDHTNVIEHFEYDTDLASFRFCNTRSRCVLTSSAGRLAQS